MLDIFTLASVAEITEAVSQKRFLDDLLKGEWPDFELREKLTYIQKEKQSLGANVAKLFVSGIQADLQSDATREYHASLTRAKSPLTAVLACESEAFITADPDRLLDGNFKVFGKGIRPARKDVGIQDRSKLLSRVQPGALQKNIRNIRASG